MITNLLHFGMIIVGLDYGHAGQMTLDEITGGSPMAQPPSLAETAHATQRQRTPEARYQGRRIATSRKAARLGQPCASRRALEDK